MSTRRGLTARKVLSVLTDIPDNASEYGDESCSFDADDDFIPAADEPSSSSEDENMDVNTASTICTTNGVVYFCVFSNCICFLCNVTNIQAQAARKAIWNLTRRIVQC